MSGSAPAAACVVVLGVWGSFAAAQGRAAGGAERLFDEGRALYARGQYAEACARFEASETLEPAVGTLLNLADCAERQGATATAWQRYREAAALAASRADPVREAVARRGADGLEARLSRLALVPASGSPLPPAAVVVRDGVAVTAADLAVAVPVDPGVHRVEITAPGYRPWTTSVGVAAGPAVARVELPSLQPEERAAVPADGVAATEGPPASATPRAEPAASPSPAGPSRTLGWVVGGAGLLVLGAGAYFALASRAAWSDVTARCPAGRCPDPATADAVSPRHDEALRDATIGTVGLAVGGAALAGGLLLVLLAPARRSTATALRVGGAADGRGGAAFASLPFD